MQGETQREGERATGRRRERARERQREGDSDREQGSDGEKRAGQADQNDIIRRDDPGSSATCQPNQARWHGDHAEKVRGGMVQRRENVTGCLLSSVTICAIP